MLFFCTLLFKLSNESIRYIILLEPPPIKQDVCIEDSIYLHHECDIQPIYKYVWRVVDTKLLRELIMYTFLCLLFYQVYAYICQHSMSIFPKDACPIIHEIREKNREYTHNTVDIWKTTHDADIWRKKITPFAISSK